MLDVAIVGGGLAGLSLALRLEEMGCAYGVYEARERFGGRILTYRPLDTDDPSSGFDLGPTWLWPVQQPRIANLVVELGLEMFSQWDDGHTVYQPAATAPPQLFLDRETHAQARRLRGGAIRLVEGLVARLPGGRLHLNHRLCTLVDRGDHVELLFQQGSHHASVRARRTVLTIPPRLLCRSVEFRPALDPRLVRTMLDTATWMAGHAKALIRYDEPFWRRAGFSGNVIAPYPGAALGEIYDACTHPADQAALFGFFAIPAHLRRCYRNDLRAAVIDQLVRHFGEVAAAPREVVVQDWYDEPLTATELDEAPPAAHGSFGHHWLQLDHWNDKLYFGGTETAARFGGYLEGALESTERIFHALLL